MAESDQTEQTSPFVVRRRALDITSIDMSPEGRKIIEEAVKQEAAKELERQLPEIVHGKMSEIRQMSRIDSTVIGSIICSLVSLMAGFLGIQMAVSGNLFVTEALVWVMFAGVAGLAILLYARANLG